MRELSDDTVRDQAEAFLAYRERERDVLSTPRLFESWSASKQLTVADREAIRREVQARLLAEGITGIPDATLPYREPGEDCDE